MVGCRARVREFDLGIERLVVGSINFGIQLGVVGAINLLEHGGLLVGHQALLVHFLVRHDAPLLNESQQQRRDANFLTFLMEGLQVIAPQLFLDSKTQMEIPQEVVQMIGVGDHN